MIPLEVKVLGGLDEFMLRLGHLKVICGIACQGGGSIPRLEREVGQTLTRFVSVPPELDEYVADYLSEKKLCPVIDKDQPIQEEERGQYRYPDLAVEKTRGSHPAKIRCLEQGVSEPLVWWVDLCLADPGVRSRVGSVTAEGKSGSKTGMSHFNDWALILELISKTGELSAEGNLIAKLGGETESGEWRLNPYLLGTERLIFGYLQLGADIDVFARFAPKLLQEKPPIVKSTATELFKQTVQEISAEADDARHLSSNQKFRLFQHARELETANRRASHKLNSTAWHRASSRVETYVDLGLLDKGKGGENERYRYVYYPNETLDRTIHSLETAKSGQQWIEESMVAALFGRSTDCDVLIPDEIRRSLPAVVAALGRPTSLLPIIAVALGIVWLRHQEGVSTSLGACRRGLEEFARAHPSAARLSRGSYGDRAEFISLDMKGVTR